ncbi:hypothetical protein [Arthrobacter pityocampae]|uniref:hypothetical protein n=1 Tax=Arthrobacter pityocampae TaxID=547334 RepID=UPI0011B00E11|nr:hypothetical protein [Arthrobacter pityocampae]
MKTGPADLPVKDLRGLHHCLSRFGFVPVILVYCWEHSIKSSSGCGGINNALNNITLASPAGEPRKTESETASGLSANDYWALSRLRGFDMFAPQVTGLAAVWLRCFQRLID